MDDLEKAIGKGWTDPRAAAGAAGRARAAAAGVLGAGAAAGRMMNTPLPPFRTRPVNVSDWDNPFIAEAFAASARRTLPGRVTRWAYSCGAVGRHFSSGSRTTWLVQVRYRGRAGLDRGVLIERAEHREAESLALAATR